MPDQNKTILLVVNKVQVSGGVTGELSAGLSCRGFHAIILRVVRNEDIPVELFDLSALTPADMGAIKGIVLEFTGRTLDA